MVNFSVAEIIAATDGSLIQGDPGVIVKGVNINSRTINPGELFLALKGENHNGHDYIAAALQRDAAAVLVMQEVEVNSGLPVIRVQDSLQALGKLARWQRRRFQIPVIGITGSNGKTSTKDLLASILAMEMAVVKTEANFNNEIGLPLTLFNLSAKTEAAVVEMGMRGLGEIKQLAEIAEPTIGVVTNVGLTHLELLGSQANIARAKSELITALPVEGLAVLNGEEPLVREMGRFTKARVVYYGIDGLDLDYRATKIALNNNGSSFMVTGPRLELRVEMPLPGRHNILNALAAIAVAADLGITASAIQRGLAQPTLTGKRLNVLKANDLTIIDDTYNASPASVRAALEVLTTTGRTGRQIAVLGDMLELGPISSAAHHEIGSYAATLGVAKLLAFGNLAAEYVQGFNSITNVGGAYFSNKAELIATLKALLQPQDTVLIKGSRGMKMEEVVQALTTEGVKV